MLYKFTIFGAQMIVHNYGATENYSQLHIWNETKPKERRSSFKLKISDRLGQSTCVC